MPSALCPMPTMPRLKNFLLTFGPLAAMLIGLPLLGAWLAGKPLAPYFEFPPQTRFAPPAPFSWTVFCFYAALIAGSLAALLQRAARSYRAMPACPSARPRPFPWWGWVAGVFGAVGWVLAWTRIEWFALLQPHTFAPLWLAYIFVVNAWCRRRTGRSLLTDRPRFFFGLFPASALFWWFFEYLNRFVQRFEIFAMPLLGYAGYLPFGLECAAVCGLVEDILPREGARLAKAPAPGL